MELLYLHSDLLFDDFSLLETPITGLGKIRKLKFWRLKPAQPPAFADDCEIWKPISVLLCFHCRQGCLELLSLTFCPLSLNLSVFPQMAS